MSKNKDPEPTNIDPVPLVAQPKAPAVKIEKPRDTRKADFFGALEKAARDFAENFFLEHGRAPNYQDLKEKKQIQAALATLAGDHKFAADQVRDNESYFVSRVLTICSEQGLIARV